MDNKADFLVHFVKFYLLASSRSFLVLVNCSSPVSKYPGRKSRSFCRYHQMWSPFASCSGVNIVWLLKIVLMIIIKMKRYLFCNISIATNLKILIIYYYAFLLWLFISTQNVDLKMLTYSMLKKLQFCIIFKKKQ